MATFDELITDYLDRLAAHTAGLPADLRDDVLADVGAHLDQARGDATTEAELRQILDRLGSPESIAAEARAGLDITAEAGAGSGTITARGTAQSVPMRRGARGLDVAAIATLALGGTVLVPLLGPFALLIWFVGIALVWASPTWTGKEKTAATLVWPGGMLLPILAGLVTGGRSCLSVAEGGAPGDELCTGFALPTWLGVPLLVVLVVAPIVVLVVLARRAKARHE